ncbi:hypothetical protein [Aquimarina aggregata]|uniref:hypothetical protein n=1 Tax=Aquimarina aggregata TaxID=1642818 RepID=UPI00248F97E8|nr:hypothetical protein [Aquimarina aggregata]
MKNVKQLNVTELNIQEITQTQGGGLGDWIDGIVDDIKDTVADAIEWYEGLKNTPIL